MQVEVVDGNARARCQNDFRAVFPVSCLIDFEAARDRQTDNPAAQNNVIGLVGAKNGTSTHSGQTRRTPPRTRCP